jgi:Skp family chaperone for outer membrane proteins
MKLLPCLLVAASLSAVFGNVTSVRAQELKLAVVDMQEALNQYYKTEVEVEKINALAEEKRKNLDERQAAYQQMTNQLTEMDTIVRDTARDEKVRQETMEKLQALAQERAVKGKEIADAQRKASQEVLTARSEMEGTLVEEIKAAVKAIMDAQGLDLIFDKSFLPKANKAILFTSPNVKDLTAETVAALNAGAPAKAN